MDPYLEGEMWQEFQGTFIHAIRAQLMPRLRPRYVALVEKRYVVDRPALGVLDLPPEQRVLYPDIHIRKVRETAELYQAQGISAPTVSLSSPMDEEVPVLSLAIQDVAERRLVTIVEFLSPVNKRGEGAREYIERRNDLMRMNTHLLEIDFVRRGGRIPLEGNVPQAPYYVYLSRFTERPTTHLWAVQLRKPLPVVPLPLLPPDEDVPLDLQGALDASFELVGYEQLMDYESPPPPPAFNESDANWIAERLRDAGARARPDTSA